MSDLNQDTKQTLKAKIEAKKLERTNKTVKLQKIEKLKEQANKDIKSQIGEENFDINKLMSSFMVNKSVS
jgi:hypothetical protein